MEKKISLEDVTFHMYDANNPLHQEFLKEFAKDELTNKYFEDWQDLVYSSMDSENDAEFAYIVEIDNNLVGLFTLTFQDLDNKNVVFSQGILPKYRGNNYASLIRNNVIEYLKSIGVENMVAYVRLANENIIRNFFKNGFRLERVGSTDLYQVTYLGKENENVR